MRFRGSPYYSKKKKVGGKNAKIEDRLFAVFSDRASLSFLTIDELYVLEKLQSTDL